MAPVREKHDCHRIRADFGRASRSFSSNGGAECRGTPHVQWRRIRQALSTTTSAQSQSCAQELNAPPYFRSVASKLAISGACERLNSATLLGKFRSRAKARRQSVLLERAFQGRYRNYRLGAVAEVCWTDRDGVGCSHGARGRSRTDTLLRAADFESAASTSSATRAARGARGGEYKGPRAGRVWVSVRPAVSAKGSALRQPDCGCGAWACNIRGCDPRTSHTTFPKS